MAENLNIILRLFAPKIFVETNPTYFTFRLNEQSLQLQTYIYIDENQVIKSVGSEPSEYNNFFKIKLFENEINNMENIKKLDLLEEFMKFAIRKLTTKMAIIRPVIIYKGLDSFNHIFHGYESSIFERVAYAAGAASVFSEK